MKKPADSPWKNFTFSGFFKIGSSPLPIWISFLIALFVTISAFDDVRLLISTGQVDKFDWSAIATTVTYWLVWIALAFQPKVVGIAFIAMLITMLPHEMLGGPLLMAFGAIAVAAYRVSTRSQALMVCGFLVWQVAWVLGVSDLSSSALWGYLLVTLLLTTPGLAMKLMREKAIRVEQAQHAAEELAARAALEQRTALARELHDVVTHGLTMIAVQANLGKLSKDEDEQHRALADIGGMARSSLDDLRRLLQTMRTDDARVPDGEVPEIKVLPSSATIDLAQSVADSQKRLNSLGFPTRVITSGDLERTPNGLRSTVLRILQEGATNAVKHAGTGSECHISMDVQDEHIEVVIGNKMTPGKPRLPVSGTGLVGLRERVSRLDGTIDAGPSDGWWSVRTVLPFTGRHTIH
ncbi:histidine kinase [Arthrobacter sp. PAMC 25486]|uniref:sensor histidine kinase n=1 Tax=Arthrobacter sp. PAMC 25486 TaxID=1494608 RepID=UPI000535D294|nr:histidine kinase [Arthrobacter sp. PAMC 25486]AIY02221.1 histidine kinase [Arthrobacter sp. PAMC 25486]